MNLERLWDPPWVPFRECHYLFSRMYSDRGFKLISHFIPVPRLRVRGAVPPLSQLSIWMWWFYTFSCTVSLLSLNEWRILLLTIWRPAFVWILYLAPVRTS